MIDLQQLMDAFGPEAGKVLHDWAREFSIGLRLGREMTNGKTAARVWTLLVQPPNGHLLKVIAKVCPADDDGDNDPREPGRHKAALLYNPDFADRHLVELVLAPLRVGERQWLIFQDIAGSGESEAVPLSDAFAALSEHPSEGPCTAESVAASCKRVVLTNLAEWRSDRPPVDRLEPSGATSSRFANRCRKRPN